MPRNTPFNLIFTVYFTTDNIASMDIVYQVTLASEIKPSLAFQYNVLDNKSEQVLVIDASDSRFSNFGNQNDDGLTFRWECEGGFQTYCDKWAGSSLLQIPNDIVQNNQLNQFYTFTAIVSSIGSGMNGLDFRKGDSFIWSNENTPEFYIVEPEFIHVSSDELIKIIPTNFRFSDPGYTYQFRITPEDAIQDPSKVQVSSAGNVFTIQAGALKWSTTYKIDVKVFKIGIQAPGEEIFYFTTGAQPLIKDTGLIVSPLSGDMFDTDFTVTLSEYEKSEPPLEFMLFGEKLGSPETQFRLMPTFEQLDNTKEKTIKILKLPEIIGIIAKV